MCAFWAGREKSGGSISRAQAGKSGPGGAAPPAAPADPGKPPPRDRRPDGAPAAPERPRRSRDPGTTAPARKDAANAARKDRRTGSDRRPAEDQPRPRHQIRPGAARAPPTLRRSAPSKCTVYKACNCAVVIYAPERRENARRAIFNRGNISIYPHSGKSRYGDFCHFIECSKILHKSGEICAE